MSHPNLHFNTTEPMHLIFRRAMSTVCIVGAGPSGLIAAKNLLTKKPGAFKVHLYDAQDGIGGLWPTSKSDEKRQVHPLMIANQSKHTMQFSDHAWDEGTSQLPQAWMVGQYLQKYLDRYLAPNEDFELHLKNRVVSAVQKDSKWEVVVQSEGKEEQHTFDYLLVATGYFGKPIMSNTLTDKASIPVIHSSQYRNLSNLIDSDSKRRKILIVGGQMSGVEIAATIASHLSSDTHSPKDSSITNIGDYKIHHVIQRPIWVFPMYTTPEPTRSAPPFLPLDFPSYNLNNRPAPLQNTQGHIPTEQASTVHNIFQNSLGTDQAVFSKLLQPSDADRSEPPHLAVSDWYNDFVRSGLITLTKGKVQSIDGTTATLADSTIDDIAAVVVATGFDPSPCIDFLPDTVLKTLNHSPKHTEQVVALAFHGTHHPDVPNLGFVGFYRSPYWGVMQMQARFMSELWSSENKPPNFQQKLSEDTSIQRTLSLRDDPRLSQFPMGDYAYLMQEFSTALSIPISSPITTNLPPLSHNDLPLNTLTPARYSLDDPDAATLLADTASTAEAGLTTPRFVSRAVFRSLLGTWRLERDLKSKLPTHPSGHFSGTAQFLLRSRTSDGLQCATSSPPPPTVDEDPTAWEYLYIEDGEFKTEQGFGFRATRRYVYRYDEATDKLSVWFAHPEQQKRADYLFHEVEFEQADKNSDGWSAKSGHLCIDDYYDVKYYFKFKAVNLERWTVAYTVNGPKKDYTIRGTYTR